MLTRRATLFALGLAGLSTPAAVQERSIVVAAGTTIQDSGLFRHILPLFQNKTGIAVKVVAQGTGQALDTARRGNADVVFVHDRAQEEKFVAEGHGVRRFEVMFNYFVLVGPQTDPAGARGTKDITVALRRIAETKTPFISRGDLSGTHLTEMALWKTANLDLGQVRGSWYREIGQGMGAALNMASASDAYLLSDRGTWLSFKNRGNLTLAVEGDRRLLNQYGVILVNPAKHPYVKYDLGQAFIDWVTGPERQVAIASFKINGEHLFFPSTEPLRKEF